MSTALLLYIPTPHRGYELLITRNPDVDTIYVWGSDLIKLFPQLRKDIHALSPQRAQQCLQSWGLSQEILVADPAVLAQLRLQKTSVVMPEEDIYHDLCQSYLDPEQVRYDESTFLRWNRDNALINQEIATDKVVEASALDYEMFRLAESAKVRASDWWRQVSGVIVVEGVAVLVGCNQHLPTAYTPYIDGNPRNNFKRGLHVELTTDQHAESVLIAEAARRGIALQGAHLYITTFPCPPCAKLVARSGITRCFFSEGYAMLDGQRVLEQHDVELVRVQFEKPPVS